MTRMANEKVVSTLERYRKDKINALDYKKMFFSGIHRNQHEIPIHSNYDNKLFSDIDDSEDEEQLDNQFFAGLRTYVNSCMNDKKKSHVGPSSISSFTCTPLRNVLNMKKDREGLVKLALQTELLGTIVMKRGKKPSVYIGHHKGVSSTYFTNMMKKFLDYPYDGKFDFSNEDTKNGIMDNLYDYRYHILMIFSLSSICIKTNGDTYSHNTEIGSTGK